MNDWYIRILLKNGCCLDGYVCSSHSTSTQLADELLAGDSNVFYNIAPNKELNGKQVFAFKRGEVAAYWVDTKPFDEPLFMKEVKFN